MNNKSDLISYFMKNPTREYHVRELAKLTGKSPNTISKHLKSYANKKILLSENKHGRLLFRANLESRNYKIEKINYNLKSLERSGLADYLDEFYENPQAIVLFGSYAKGEDVEESDVDILVVSSSKKEISAEERNKFEKLLGHEIQVFIRSSKDIKKMMKTNTALLNSFANGIVSRGFFEVVK